MAKKFTAQVDDFILKTDKRMIAVARQSTQDLSNQAQVPTAKGGKMRVKTGFLRASGQMSLTGVPSGPSRPNADGQYEYDEGATIATLAGYKLGNTIFFGWTADYAKYRELYDGFLASSVQNWQKIVNNVVMQVRAKIR